MTPSSDHGGAREKTKDQHTMAEEVKQWNNAGLLISLRSPQMIPAFLTDKGLSSIIHSTDEPHSKKHDALEVSIFIPFQAFNIVQELVYKT